MCVCLNVCAISTSLVFMNIEISFQIKKQLELYGITEVSIRSAARSATGACLSELVVVVVRCCRYCCLPQSDRGGLCFHNKSVQSVGQLGNVYRVRSRNPNTNPNPNPNPILILF